MTSDARAQRRAEFNKRRDAEEAAALAKAEEEERLKKAQEEREIAELRRQLVPKVRLQLLRDQI